ncbi:hypothetical protein QYE76_014312 [Lolium multiflorum]|uniref:Retrotransposon gag domain-containing protein n=1 Tax=Lolium multiflorum TaxID=4521 RepID=A0AAD8U0H4_LOLMU|nr:hypothetical protein QYE76_014312 [Lolium multiflorum]
MQDEADGAGNAPEQQEAVGESEAPEQQEDAGDKEELILGNLSPISDDTSTMDTEEYNRLTEELEDEEQAEAESPPPKEVLATITGLGEDADEEATPSDPMKAGPSDSESKDYLTSEELVEQAGIGALIHTEVLNKPITPEEAADPVALEARRREMLATAKKISTTAAAMLEEKQEAQEVMDGFRQREREAVDSLQKAKKLREHWEFMIKDAHKEANKIRRDAIGPRKITFASPSNQQPLTTPKENMQKATELLAKKNEEIDINHLRTLIASAVRQQSKADTSRKLESDPELCMSTAQKDASKSKHRDDKSRTGSSERRRRTREHPNPIPVPSKTPSSDPKKGKDAIYTGRDKYRNPSPPPNGYPRPPPPRRRSPAGNTRPHGPGGINIPDNVVPQRNRNRERTPEPRRSRNEERDTEPRRSRNDGGDQHHGEGSHRSWSLQREGRGESEGGSKRSHRPPRRSPSPPPSGGGGGGGGGGGRRSRSRSKSPRNGSRDARERLNEYKTDYIGPKCFGRMIRQEPKPRMNLKLPGNLKHYDGSEMTDTWIEDYYNASNLHGGTPNIACRMLQLYLVGPARICLSDLEKDSIFCWFDLKNAFEKHFRGTYKRPATTSDLQACIQKKGETSRSFLTRWSQTRNECENVDNRTSMHVFIGGLPRGGLLRHKLTCLVNANKLTLDDMITIASVTPLPMTTQRGGQGGGRGRGRGGGAGRGQQRGDEVTAAGTRAPQTYEEYRDMPCLAHIDPATGKSSHTNRNCKWVNDLKTDSEAGYKRARKHRPHGKGGKGNNKDKEEDSSEAMDEDDASPDPKEGSTANKSNPFVKKSAGAYHTFLGTPTVRAKNQLFGSERHARRAADECYALVVSPRIDGYDFSKCLMDGGASLNIMYLETLERMNLTKEQLKHNTEFHGVVPGKKAKSLCSIRLLVAFGDVNNFREEMITFEVVPFKSSYRVIFGRPTYHKFHARACYIYNKLKIPGPNGMITISGDYKKAHEFELGEPAIETKKIDFKEGDSSKQVSVGASMDPKWEDALVEFLRANMDIFA